MRTFVFLLLIVFVAVIFRFWQLGLVPPSPDWDEVALGYNAYSILETGRDEYGEFLPIVLRSFDDYKPALYTYIIIPFIKLFGLTVFAVRIPSAIFGALTVVATFFLIKEVFINYRYKEYLGLLTTLLMAISPWHIQFSRIAFEANVGLAINILAALLFLKGIKKHWLLLFSSLLAGLNLYAYQGEKVFTPLLLLALVAINWKNLRSVPKKFIVGALLLGLVVSMPMMHYVVTNKEAMTRAQGVSVYANQTEFLKRDVDRLVHDREQNDSLGLLLDNRRIVYAKSIISGYLAHTDLNWLFLRGDLARHHAPQMGLLYLWELPFLLVGIYMLIFGPFDKRVKAVVFAWFLISPIPASITSGVPHAIRTLNFLPTFQVFIAIGIMFALAKVLSTKYQVLSISVAHMFITCYVLLVTFNIAYYINQYFVQQNYFFSKDWQYGYKEAVEEIATIENKYDKIIVSNTPHMDQSYMFFLFYLKYPPAIYQQEAQGVSGGFKENHAYSKFEFRPIDWNNEEKTSHTLFVGRPDDFSKPFEGHVKTINFLNNEPAIVLVEGK